VHGKQTSLTLELSDLGAEVVLVLAGELDVSTSPLLQAVLDPLIGPRRTPAVRLVVVDMAGVRFADAAGLSPLLHARAALGRGGGCVRVRHPGRPVGRVLDVLGLQDMVEQQTA
jgi:anti-anti-sigma factor